MSTIKGPGLLHVTSRISQPEILSETQYLHWYDDDHIAEIMQTSGIQSAFRYIDTDPRANKPYLAFYPMDNLAFTQGEEFRKIGVRSKLLPGSGLVYDLADLDVRYDGLVEVGERRGKKEGPAVCIVAVVVEPGSGQSGEEVDSWMKSNHTQMMARIPGYQRTTRYRLLYARTNAQSRALKGLAPTSNEPVPEPPTWHSIHEFGRPVKPEDMQEMKETEQAKKTLGNAKQVECRIFKLAKAHGEKIFFD